MKNIYRVSYYVMCLCVIVSFQISSYQHMREMPPTFLERIGRSIATTIQGYLDIPTHEQLRMTSQRVRSTMPSLIPAIIFQLAQKEGNDTWICRTMACDFLEKPHNNREPSLLLKALYERLIAYGNSIGMYSCLFPLKNYMINDLAAQISEYERMLFQADMREWWHRPFGLKNIFIDTVNTLGVPALYITMLEFFVRHQQQEVDQTYEQAQSESRYMNMWLSTGGMASIETWLRNPTLAIEHLIVYLPSYWLAYVLTTYQTISPQLLTRLVANRRIDSIQVFLTHPMSCVLEDVHKNNALWCAVKNKNHAIARLLLAHNAQINTPDISSGKRTPLMIASGLNDTAMVRLLLDHGAEVMAQDDQGFDVLNYVRSPDIHALMQERFNQYHPLRKYAYSITRQDNLLKIRILFAAIQVIFSLWRLGIFSQEYT